MKASRHFQTIIKVGLSRKKTPEPETKPDNGQALDESKASELVEELKEKLPELDDETVEAITEKWDAHEDLAGKTKPQILKILFNDCKAIVKDKETQNAIWKALNESEISNIY